MTARSVLPGTSRGSVQDSPTRVARRVDLCIVNAWFYPTLVGPGERFRRYAPGLQARGIDMRVFTAQRPGLAAREMVDGIVVRRLPIRRGSRRRELGFVYKVLWIFLKKRERPDVLQFFSRSPWNIPFILASRFLGIRTLLVFTLLGENGGSPLRRRLRDLYRHLLFRLFDCVVTSSSVMTRELTSLGVPPDRIETIPNGVDLKRFRPPRDGSERKTLRTRLGLDPDGEVVLFIGGMLPRKGVDILLEAWQEVSRIHPSAQLVLVGPRYEDQVKYAGYRQRIESLIASAAVPERIHFTGTVSNVEDYLRASDVFVFPSLREGMPNVVPEAMATGLACILTPFVGLPDEFGRGGRVYLVVPRIGSDLATALTALLGDGARRAELGKRARAWVEEHLDVERSLDRFARLYRDLAEKGHHPGEQR